MRVVRAALVFVYLFICLFIMDSASSDQSLSDQHFLNQSNIITEMIQEDFSANLQKGVRVQTSFGDCPKRLLGNLTFNILEVFNNNFSLLDVKRKIVKEGLKEKNFLSYYQVNYDPVSQLLKIAYECPKAITSVLVYGEGQVEKYRAVLGDNGILYDPTYEIVLKEEKKINQELPLLTIYEGEVDKKKQEIIAKITRQLTQKFKAMIANYIINRDAELVIVISYKGIPINAFLGDGEWLSKTIKLEKIIDQLSSQGKIPVLVNLLNTKKIVVKFQDNF